MKPEKQLTEIVKQCAVNGGRKFWHITEIGTTNVTYNPIKNGSAEHARNILVGAEEFAANGGFSEPYYWTAGQRLTLLVIKVLDDLIQQKETYLRGGERFFWERDFYHVSKLMIISILENVKDKLTPKVFSDVCEFLAEIS